MPSMGYSSMTLMVGPMIQLLQTQEKGTKKKKDMIITAVFWHKPMMEN